MTTSFGKSPASYAASAYLSRDMQKQTEREIKAVNDKDMVVIECKSNLSLDDVNKHLTRLKQIKRLMPRYKENRISGAVAGMVIPGNIATYAIRKGLYVMGQNGDHLELRNDAVFVAKVW